jgi:hypothetical protein
LFASILYICFKYNFEGKNISTSTPWKIYFLCQTKRLNIFLVRSFSYRQLIWHKKYILLSLSRGKYCLNHLENWKETSKWNYYVEIFFETR